MIVDMHTHVLHGVDDGSDTIDGALLILKAMEEAGTGLCVCTPHFNPPYYDLDGAEERFAELAAAAQEKGRTLSLILGCETALHSDLLQDLKSDRIRTLGESRTVLLEMPEIPLPPRFREFIFQAAAGGLRPVLAHPERNTGLVDDPALLAGLRASGALVQVTASAVTGTMGKKMRGAVRRFLKEGLVDLIASDVHGPYGRGVDLRAAATEAARYVGDEAAMAMISSTPLRILEVNPDPSRPA